MDENTPGVQTPQPATQLSEPQPTEQPSSVSQPTPQQQDVIANRTREQFDKLLESNSRLYEQNELLRKEMTDRLSSLEQPQPVPQPAQTPAQPAASEHDFYETDPTTGETYINREKLNRYMKEVQEKANRAEQSVQKIIRSAEENEIERQNLEAYHAYPELKPDAEKFDGTFYRQVRGVLTDSMLNANEYGGRPLTFKQAADFVKGVPSGGEPAGQESGQARQEGQALKEAGSAQVSSQHQPQIPMEGAEELRALQIATRKGSTEALAERIKHTPHIKIGE
jgi:hypothetical protein